MKSSAREEVVQETRERLLRLRADDTPIWGQMTVGQMLRHVCRSIEMALGERIEPRKKGPPPDLIRWAVLWAPIRWPKNVGSPAGLIDSTPASLEEWLGKTLETMDAVAYGSRFGKTHPILGTMSPTDWKRCMYLHADHHLRQFGQ